MRNNRSLRFTLSAVALFTLCYLLLTGGRKPTAAFAAENGTTAGQLTMLGKNGQPAALCPLHHTDVVADVSGYCARVTVKQDFSNPSRETIEAVYTFPFPSDAAVDDMTMTIGRRVVKGEIKRREEARVIYENAKANGQTAALLDQERPNIFTQSIANITPGERISITISYVQILKYKDGEYEFTYPMVVGPRFIAGGGPQVPGQRGVAGPNAQNTQVPEGSIQAVVTDGDKISPPITSKGTRAGHDISLTVNLDAGLPLQDIQSELHEVAINKIGETRAVVKLANQSEIPNRDFMLRYRAAGSDMQEGLLAYADGKSGYFTLIMQPPAAPAQKQVSHKEMVFVIDQTGSQAGEPIKKAKETMRYCIKNLSPGDTFQLLAFNTENYPCFPAPVEATLENIQTALKFLEPIEGNGGTDILKAVDYALKIPDDPDRLRIVCYMTDGYVGNDMQIIEHIKKYRGRARMFPFGAGNSINHFLIDGMAREGRGEADIIDLNGNGEAIAAKFYKRISQPLLLDIHIDWNGLPVEDVFPKQIPDLFSAGPIILKGRYSKAGEADITVHGLLRGQPWSRTVHVVLPARKNDGAALATVWAREKIEDLQSEDWMGAQNGHPIPDIKEKIVNCALEYRLMSQYTSFVAVEQRVVNVGGKQRTVDVPVEMPDGVSYDGIFGNKETEQLAKRGVTRLSRKSLASGVNGNATSFGRMAGGSAGAAPAATLGYQPQALGAVVGKPAALAQPTANEAKVAFSASHMALSDNILSEQEGRKSSVMDLYLVNRGEAEKKILTLKPANQKQAREQIKQYLRTTKLHAKLIESLKKPGTQPLELQIWVKQMPANGVAKLKALGFTLTSTLTPGRLLLGTISADKLDKVLALQWVVFVEPPKFK